MSRRHLHEATLVAYVDGTLEGDAARELGVHVSGCAECAARLQRAAWLETAMFEAAGQMHPPRALGWARRLQRVVQLPASLALAAAMVLGFGVPARWLELDVGAGVRVARADVGDGHGATPWDGAPECEAPEDSGGETCDDPTMGDDLLAMGELTSWPDPDDEICVDADGSELACPGGEPRAEPKDG